MLLWRRLVGFQQAAQFSWQIASSSRKWLMVKEKLAMRDKMRSYGFSL
jgi:hypothetical protein